MGMEATFASTATPMGSLAEPMISGLFHRAQAIRFTSTRRRLPLRPLERSRLLTRPFAEAMQAATAGKVVRIVGNGGAGQVAEHDVGQPRL